MTAPPAPDVRPPKRRLPRILIAFLAIGLSIPILLVGGLFGGFFFLKHRTEMRLASAIAEADRSDPNWRLKDLLASRPEVPDERNSAVQVRTALGLLPPGWLAPRPPGRPEPSEGRPGEWELLIDLEELAPPARPGPELLVDLRAELAALAPAVAAARRVAKMPKGRHEVRVESLVLDPPLEETEGTRRLARLLQLDIALRAEEGDADGALESCRAIVNTGRSIGDEPFVVSQLVRISLDGAGILGIQRALAQGEPSEAALAETEALLADEARGPIMLFGLRGERAGFSDMMEKLKTGELSFDELADSPGGRSSKDSGMDLHQSGIFFASNHAIGLEFLNRYVTIAGLPPEEQPALLGRIEAEVQPPRNILGALPGTIAYSFLIPINVSCGADVRARSELDCALVMLASERYRRSRGRWPESADALVPAFLDRIPTDPYGGGPIRLGRVEDGLVVYSVGPDREDDGGRLAPRHLPTSQDDFGYRLWDPARRRQPPSGEPPKGTSRGDGGG
jgi:hypothetical protein